jgi:cysteine-S-conjugate beta-lyase
MKRCNFPEFPMPSDDGNPSEPNWHSETRLVRANLGWQPPDGFRGLATPVHRASTVLFDSADAFRRRREQGADMWVYGTIGTPTTKTLEHQISLAEGGADTCLAPSGLAAVTLTYLALLNTGDHVLVPQNVYDPSRFFATGFCRRMGIEATFYDPLDLAALAAAFRENTRLVWVETPGSLTFEVADLPAIAALAHARGAKVAIDNTWSGGLFLKPFALGADVSVQALTKYHGGHGDLVMGSVTTIDAALAKQVRSTRESLGFSVNGDDCFLVLRTCSRPRWRWRSGWRRGPRWRRCCIRHWQAAQVMRSGGAIFPGRQAFSVCGSRRVIRPARSMR